MSLSDEQEKRLDQMRENYLGARTHLLSLISEMCPGPHLLVQHRDAKPAWCNVCGRDQLGYQQRKISR